MTKSLELKGKKFGKLTVINRVRPNDKGSSWWLVNCECGKSKEIRGASLNRGVSQSCGCVKRKTTQIGESAKWSLFTLYVIGAKRRGRIFTLRLEEFLNITSKPCHYCGIEWSSEYPKTIYKENGSKKNLAGSLKLNGFYRHNGIDRVDNSIGYVSDNCVPCCKFCNHAKLDMTVEEFKSHIKRIFLHLIKSESKEILVSKNS